MNDEAQGEQVLQAIMSQILEDIDSNSATTDERLQLSDALLERILVEIALRLGKAGTEQLDSLIQAKSDARTIERFLSEQIPEYQELTRSIVEDFRTQMTQ